MKKHNSKVLSLVFIFILSIALVFTFAACGEKQATSETKQPASEVKTGTAKGFGGDIKVSVTVENGKITELTVDAPSETAEIGGKAIPDITNAIIAKGSVDGVDTVAGATYTSEGVINAVKAALGAK